MTSIRLLAGLMGLVFMLVFLCAVLLVAVSERAWLGALIMVSIFGSILVIGSVQWWKSWSQRAQTEAIEVAFNKKYKYADYFLLAIMGLCALPIFLFHRELPDAIKNILDTRGMFLAIVSTTIFTAFMWQPDSYGKITNAGGSAILGIIATAVGIWFLKAGSSRDAFIGYCLLYSAGWSLLRAGVLIYLDRMSERDSA
jgi:hypothetical protein